MFSTFLNMLSRIEVVYIVFKTVNYNIFTKGISNKSTQTLKNIQVVNN